MGTKHTFAGLLQHSVKAFGFHQEKTYEAFVQTSAGFTDHEVSNMCYDGTCAAIAARWAYEKACKDRLKYKEKMFVGKHRAKSHYQARKDTVLEDPRSSKLGFAEQEWAKIDQERTEKQKKLFQRHVSFYQQLGRIQADGFRDANHDCIVQFDKYYSSSKKNIKVSANSIENAHFNDDVVKMGTPSQFVSLEVLKEVRDSQPLYVVYRMRSLQHERIAHAIAVIHSSSQRVLFDPNAGEYSCADDDAWGKFIDEYINIVENKAFSAKTVTVTLYSVRVTDLS